MKKYKLIKEYPGSYKIGYTTIQVEPCPSYSNYPEFWEEVVEKDYEILSFINDEKLVWNKAKDCRFDAKWQMYRPTEKDCLNETRIYIHSVKRLSDSEIFTIGDKCSPIGKYRGNIHSITKIWFCNPGYLRLSSNNYTLGIKDIQKVKIPLFTTEDSVDIFDYSKDHFYYVKKESFKLCENLKVTNSNVTFKYEPEKELYFSTKEKAEEYILMNKPCLSLNDVAKVYVSAGFEITNSNKNIKYVKQQLQLRELIKTKLKKAL